MFRDFINHYLELPPKSANIVCLGGGVGTAQILKGLRKYEHSLTAVVSMADDGGSAGRLRRAFAIPPPGDLVNCLAALSEEESILKDLFVYRFSGNRYGSDTDIRGQKLGNLIFLALADIYHGDPNKALEKFSKIISPKGKVLPATIGDVNIWAKTKSGKKVSGEQNIDLGRYDGDHTLSEVHLDPPNPKTYKPVLTSLASADLIIAGPGDLFSTVLPVLIVPQIKNIIKKTHTRKIFIVNIANKPFETANFKVSDYLKVLESHLSDSYFDTILVNNNQKLKIPKSLNYHYVVFDKQNLRGSPYQVIEDDVIDENFPIYHDSEKVAKVIISQVK